MSRTYSLLLTSALMLLLTGCTLTQKGTSAKELAYREDILLKANNYDGLIDFYRQQLKERESAAIRLKLARYYYLNNDSTSSLHYLEPLLENPGEEVSLLQAKNLIVTGRYYEAVTVTDRLLQKKPKSAEAWNLRGIALAQQGQLNASASAIKQARGLFIADTIALNNLAVLEMVNGRYEEAVRLLLPQYLKGKKDRQLMHNLVFALVQMGDSRYARELIETEKLSTQPERLILALSQVEKFKTGKS